jgi:hypothetical protein
MAKKSRRARRTASQAAQPVRIARPAASEAKVKEVDFAKEYHYVIEDLRRIAITAAALLVLLIVLAVAIS